MMRKQVSGQLVAPGVVDMDIEVDSRDVMTLANQHIVDVAGGMSICPMKIGSYEFSLGKPQEDETLGDPTRARQTRGPQSNKIEVSASIVTCYRQHNHLHTTPALTTACLFDQNTQAHCTKPY